MSESWIIRRGECADAHLLGAKAASLAALDGFGVPAWFAVTPTGVRALSDEATRAAVAQAMRAAVEQLGGAGDGGFAVRSSALCEDGAAHSFAGMFESYLRIAADDVVRTVEKVGASARSERAGAYQHERGVADGSGVEMAVLVQRMVEAQWAGVAFAVDPITGDDTVVISAVEGTAEELVAGGRDGQTVRVDRDGSVQGVEPGGSLPEEAARRIAALAREVSRAKGSPQDIEWAWSGEGLHLLQARPITTVSTGAVTIWDNSNIAESYEGVTTPLTFSFASRAYEEVYRTFCRLMGVPRGQIEANSAMFRNMLGYLNGRVYYNLMNWYRLVAMLPGYSVNAGFMEQMMGVSASLPDEARGALRREAADAGGSRALAGVRFARSCAALLVQHATLGRRIQRFERRLDEALGEGPTFSGVGEEALAAQYRDLERRLLPHWDAPILNDFFAMVYAGLLARLCSRLGEDGVALHAGLLQNVGHVISTEPARRIARMAAQAAELSHEDAGLLRILAAASASEAMAHLDQHPVLRQSIDSYIVDLGDRCLQELKLESATLLDDPTPLLRSIGAMAARPPEHSREARAPMDAEAPVRPEEQLRRLTRKRPLIRLALWWVLPRARARLRDRENLRFARTRVFGRVRRILLELGRRMEERGLLDAASDVFFLEVEEALGVVAGTATTSDVRGLVRLRRAQHERWQQMPALPARFETRGSVTPLRPIIRHAAAALPADDQARSGLGCCAGIVRGRARIIREPAGIQLRPDEIIVAERTDPGWVLLFPAAAAVIVEHGSILSHTSIVARELGVPCVVGVPGLLEWVMDGETLEVDGSTGIVRRVGGEA